MLGEPGAFFRGRRRSDAADSDRTGAAEAKQEAGGALNRYELDGAELAISGDVDVLALDEALDRLAGQDAQAARLVKLRFFGGMTMREAALALSLSERNAERLWTYARSYLRIELGRPDD